MNDDQYGRILDRNFPFVILKYWSVWIRKSGISIFCIFWGCIIMRYLKAITAMVALSVAYPSVAGADAYCSNGKPPLRILTYHDGGVLLLTDWRGDFVQICNLDQNWKGIPTSVCFAWMSKITSAINSGKGVGIYYSGVSGDACKTLPTYGAAPAPVYVSVQN